MNAKRVAAAAGVILAAQKNRQTAAGIAYAQEAAGLLQSPESAAELVALRAERDGFRAQRNTVFATNEELLARVERTELERLKVLNENRSLKRRVAKLETALAALTRPGALAEQAHLVDPLDHVLEHLADNLPEVIA